MPRSFFGLAAIAFFVGMFFRLYHDYQVGFFRMFGTLGLAVFGLMLAKMLGELQRSTGESDLEAVVARLGGKVERRQIVRGGGAGLVRVEEWKHGDRAIWVGVDNSPNHRGRIARWLFKRTLVRLVAIRDAHLRAASGTIPLVCVPLRRAVRADERRVGDQLGVRVVNPDHLLTEVESFVSAS